MSTGRPHADPHQVPPGHCLSAQSFYGQHAAAGLQDASVPVMVASHFHDFSFPFTSLPDQSPPLDFDDHPATHYSHHPQQRQHQHQHQLQPQHQHQPQPQLQLQLQLQPEHQRQQQRHHPGHTVASNGMAAAAFRAGSENRKSSPGTSDESNQDRNSPTENSYEDPAADDFGLVGHGRGDGTDLGGKAHDDKNGSSPAWSELKTKAGKDRKRLPLACIACRRKKIRCSGEKPACKHCLRSRIPCVYKVTTRKAAPRTDYMAMLDKRLKRMEERIIKIVPKADHEGSPSVVRAIVKPPMPGTGPPNKQPGSRKRGSDEAFGPDIEAWAKAPSKSGLPEAAGLESTSLEVREEEEDKLFREGIDALPPKDVQEHLAEVFFDNVYGQAYHLLHKPSYMRKLRNNALPPVLVLSVCAVAARFTPNPKIVRPTPRQFLRGEEWASHARDICTRRYEWPNITILTCLLMLGLHEFGTCHGGRSWALGGQAIRMAFALQLHKDLEYDPLCRAKKTPLSFIDREIRRRIMWACFLMDRFNSSGSDRPMFIKEESIKIPLPVGERCFQLDMPVETESPDGSPPSVGLVDTERQLAGAEENRGVAAFTIRSIAIWGRIVTYLNQGGKELDPHPMWSPESDYAKLVGDVEAFARTLPATLQYTPHNLDLQITEKTANQFLLLHLSVQQNTLFLSQAGVTFASGRAGLEAPEDFLSEVGVRTFAAANRISDIIRDSEQSQCCVSAPFAGYCAFSSTTIHIMGIFSGSPVVKATAEANSGVNIRFLRKMMRYWGMFQWMVENIRSQYRSAMNASQSGMSNGDGSAASSIIQYGDWFNKYPHGLSDADFLDPTMNKKKEKGEDAVLEQKPELQSVEDFFTTLSPSLNAETKDAHRAGSSKRRQMAKRLSEAGSGPSANVGGEPFKSEPPAGRRPGTGQGGPARQYPPASQPKQPLQPQPQQLPPKFSASLGGQTSGPATFTPLGMPQPQPQPQSYPSMSPISPATANPFTQQPPPPPSSQHAFFSADMLTMNMPQQQHQLASGFAQPLGRQLSFGAFSVDSPESGAVSDGRNHTSGPNPLTRGAMDGFGGQDTSAWFVPLTLDGPEANQGMGLGMGGDAADPFATMFGITPGQLDALQHTI